MAIAQWPLNYAVCVSLDLAPGAEWFWGPDVPPGLHQIEFEAPEANRFSSVPSQARLLIDPNRSPMQSLFSRPSSVIDFPGRRTMLLLRVA